MDNNLSNDTKKRELEIKRNNAIDLINTVSNIYKNANAPINYSGFEKDKEEVQQAFEDGDIEKLNDCISKWAGSAKMASDSPMIKDSLSKAVTKTSELEVKRNNAIDLINTVSNIYKNANAPINYSGFEKDKEEVQQAFEDGDIEKLNDCISIWAGSAKMASDSPMIKDSLSKAVTKTSELEVKRNNAIDLINTVSNIYKNANAPINYSGFEKDKEEVQQAFEDGDIEKLNDCISIWAGSAKMASDSPMIKDSLSKAVTKTSELEVKRNNAIDLINTVSNIYKNANAPINYSGFEKDKEEVQQAFEDGDIEKLNDCISIWAVSAERASDSPMVKESLNKVQEMNELNLNSENSNQDIRNQKTDMNQMSSELLTLVNNNGENIFVEQDFENMSGYEIESLYSMYKNEIERQKNMHVDNQEQIIESQGRSRGISDSNSLFLTIALVVIVFVVTFVFLLLIH